MLREFSVEPASSSSQGANTDNTFLSKDELNALQYACGYVPHSLLKKFQKRSGRKYDQFIQCLGEMAVHSELDDIDFLAYTRHWIDKVNRGGLFPLYDDTFKFFICTEKEVHPSFMAKPGADSCAFKEIIIKRIMHSEDVEWNWTLLSQCIDAESDAIELLEAIVTLCVTVRGFAITATRMEVYKTTTKKTTAKNPGLRKGLSRQC